jgi:hypothetical protein
MNEEQREEIISRLNFKHITLSNEELLWKYLEQSVIPDISDLIGVQLAEIDLVCEELPEIQYEEPTMQEQSLLQITKRLEFVSKTILEVLKPLGVVK